LAVAYAPRRRDQLGRTRLGQLEPAGDEVAVMAGEEQALVLRARHGKGHRGREAAIERQDRARHDAGKDDAVPAAGDMEHAVADMGALDALPGQFLAILADQAEGERDVHETLALFARRRGERLFDLDREAARLGVIGARHRDVRRAGLMVPEGELAEILAGSVLERGEEILD